MVGLWGQSSLIASVQRGTISLSGSNSGTATIAAVLTENSVLRMLGNSMNSTQLGKACTALTLTNSTTITGSVDTAPTPTTTVIGFEIVEYQAGVVKSVQRTTASVNTAVTITTVNTAKSELHLLGMTDAGTVDTISSYMPRVTLTNATTVTPTIVSGNSQTTRVQVVEFF